MSRPEGRARGLEREKARRRDDDAASRLQSLSTIERKASVQQGGQIYIYTHIRGPMHIIKVNPRREDCFGVRCRRLRTELSHIALPLGAKDHFVLRSQTGSTIGEKCKRGLDHRDMVICL